MTLRDLIRLDQHLIDDRYQSPSDDKPLSPVTNGANYEVPKLGKEFNKESLLVAKGLLSQAEQMSFQAAMTHAGVGLFRKCRELRF